MQINTLNAYVCMYVCMYAAIHPYIHSAFLIFNTAFFIPYNNSKEFLFFFTIFKGLIYCLDFFEILELIRIYIYKLQNFRV